VTRYRGMPAGYGAGGKIPGLILSLRLQPEGGELASNVQQKPLPDTYARIEAVVLVHGFNNHECEAAEAYLGFRSRQYSLAKRIPPSLENVLADVLWPGDAAGRGVFDVADAAIYPGAVGTAKDAAPRLARHLRSMPNLRTVHFVGHSLGCRLILETVDDLRRNGGPAVGKLCLMAAAVPVFMVKPGGDLAAAMEYAQEVRILHSYDDGVLQLTFPAGQTLASGNEGRFPTALGREPPDDIPGRIDPILINKADHSDYWGYNKNLASSAAAEKIASFFQFGNSPRAVELRTAGLAPRSGSAQPRELGRARAIGEG